MSILVINSGSTSIKYKLFSDDETELKQGEIIDVKNHQTALKQILRDVGGLQDLIAVGHRVVHGGDRFLKPLVIDDNNLIELEQFNELAPLHNPYNLAGIKAIREYLPQVKQVAVFDTAFYANLPLVNRLYGLPCELTEKYKIYHYGFHGISHKYIMLEAARELKISLSKINLISCHLGGGWSITAIKNGNPIDTSMGFTPLEGLMMMSRPGDVDDGIIFRLLKEMPGEINSEKIERLSSILNHDSGIKGISGIADFKKLLSAVSLGQPDAELAFDLAVNRLVKYIGAYWTELEGKAQAIVFTGAIGSGNPMTRNQVMKKIKCLGKLPMLAIQTNEELMIAREVKELVNNVK